MFDPNKQIQSLPFDVADCPTLDDVLSMFEEQHRRSEILYKGDGIWDDGRPRNTSRRVLGYIDADYKTPRIVEGLKHLSKYEYDGFYEGGLAAATLALGSARVSRKYIHPAIDLCKKMYHVSPSNSPNMDGFATFGLAETARAIDPNNPAVAFLMAAQNLMCVNVLRQTPTGTWSLHRDQKIYYHSIVTRGLISLLAMLPETYYHYNEQDGMAHKFRPAAYLAINHIIARMKTDGTFEVEPGAPVNGWHPIPAQVLALAYTELDLPVFDAVQLAMRGMTNKSNRSYERTGASLMATGAALKAYRKAAGES